VIVIGGGIAGVAAALASTDRGARVTLVRRAPGATMLTAGGWQGPLPEPLDGHFEAAGHPWPVIQQLLPAPDGSLRRYARAARAQSRAEIVSLTLVAGINGLAGFEANVLARMWSEVTGEDVQAVTISLERTPSAGWSPPALAAEIARAPDQVRQLLAPHIEATRARAVILPAVLGLEPEDNVRQAIESGIDVAVGEALAASPSIPGWRLGITLDRMLARAGVNVIVGTATRAVAHDGRLEAVAVRAREGERQLEANAFVLASGKYIGGGIITDGRLREAVLDCPVWIEHAGEIFEQAEPLALTNADRREEQPLLGAGVAVDAEGHPVDRNAEPIFQNLWAAGAVRRGYDSPASGLGHAATEGWAAGERASA
jgi:glycerol-3-phosphate dehydrogenase subunit B